MRKTLLTKINNDLKKTSIPKLARGMGVGNVTLWRILKGKFRGNIETWEKIERYYR